MLISSGYGSILPPNELIHDIHIALNDAYNLHRNGLVRVIGTGLAKNAFVLHLNRHIGSVQQFLGRDTSKDEVSQRDVERHLSLKNPTVTGILKRLDEKGYIFCVPNENDRRKKKIYLTEKAYDIRRRMESDRRRIDKELTRGMTRREVDALRKYLEKLLYNIAEP